MPCRFYRLALTFPVAILVLFLVVAVGTVPAGGQAEQELIPRMATLQAEKIPLSQALKKLADQTGIAVDRNTKDDPELKLDLKQVPFWQALDTVAQQANARVYPHQRNGRIALVDGPRREVPLYVSYNGLFRTAVRRITAVQDFETAAHYYTVSLEVAWEPHFQPFLLETRPRSLAVRVLQDGKDRDLPIPPAGSVQAPVDGRIALVLDDIRLPAPDRSVSKISLLKGSLTVIGPTKMLPFAFDALDKAQGQQRTKDGVSVKVTKVVLDQNRWTVQVALDYPSGGPKFESFQSWLVNNEMYLVNAAEQRFPNNGNYTTDKVTANQAVVSYHFIDEPKKNLVRGKASDWKVVYVTPAKIVEVQVPFEFKDLPLP